LESSIVLDKRGRAFGWPALGEAPSRHRHRPVRGGVTVIAIEGSELNDIMEKNSHIGFVVMKRLAEVTASRFREAKKLVGERIIGIL